MDEIRVPIYLMTGFLESGKTSFLNFTIAQDYFYIEGTTLLILCEEGEGEYDSEVLKASHTFVEIIDKEENLTTELLNSMEILYQPERVIIEYNGMWQVSKLEQMTLPKGWGIEQHITTVDCSTFPMYLSNMKSQFMDMVRNADMAVFNRCKQGDPLAAYRRGIKVANQKVQIIFEDEEGEIEDIFDGEMPFDINAPIIDIAPEDYGIWFVDAMDNPDNYEGKTVRFKGRVQKPKPISTKCFVPGRTAMTCCADDTTFLGFICKSEDTPKYHRGDWVEVTAKIKVESQEAYYGFGPVLYAEKITVCEPLPEEMVYFN